MMGTAKKERGLIVPRGMGGFLNPPTHPEHTYGVETDLGRHPDDRGSMSLSAAVESEWLDPTTRQEARAMLESWKRPPIDSPEVVEWIRQVLGYFAGCYRCETRELKDDADGWNASDLTIDQKRTPILYTNSHAGVRLIRKYYPEYTPSQADFDNAKWGA